MSVFFGLPDELCKDIVSEWLAFHDLKLLDSAVCSNQWREQLLDFLPSYKGCISYFFERQDLLWMNRRGIPVHKLILCKEMNRVRWIRALASVWKNLRVLTVDEDANAGSEFAVHLNTCAKLEYLCIRKEGFNLAALKGEVFKNLTYLDLPLDDCPLYVLNLVQKHCRLLKTFHYEFKLTDATSTMLLDIRHNVDLVSVKLPVNESILEELTALYSHKLTHISLVGEVDCNTMIHVLRNFDRIDHINVSAGVDDSVKRRSLTYVNNRQCLEVENGGHGLEGWNQLIALLPDLLEIKWREDTIITFDICDLLGRSVNSLEIACEYMEQDVLGETLIQCEGLTRFSFSCKDYIEWPEVMSDSNRIEILAIEGNGEFHKELFTLCRYLTEVTFTHCTITHDRIPALAAAIKKYKHAITGQPIVCECEIFVEEVDIVDTLHYDGRKFTGTLWHDYQDLIEACTTEKDESITRLTCKVKDLEAEVKALKKQLLQR